MNPMTPTFLCPYCYEVHHLSDISYHCKKCEDYKPATKKGTRKISTLFTAPSQICPTCGTSSSAVCPSCKRKLPEGTLSGTNTIISTVDMRGSGKSHCAGVLINELNKRIAADFEATSVRKK